MKNGGWLDAYNDVPEAQNGIEGTMGGLTDKGFNYNGAWGGTMQIGGEIPQAQDGLLEKLKSRLNPYNWGVEDYSKEKDFNKAYSTAKKSGEKEFMYKGKRYNTKYAGTPRQEVGVYGVDGKPVNIKEASDPSQVNLYPAFGKYLPGHVSASVTSDSDAASVDYSSTGNNPFGLSKVKNKGEHTYYVYGADQDKFYEKAAALPTGDYMLEDKYTPSDWNLFTNNCADNVCDAFGIPRSKGIQTPSGAVSKIKKKYPTLDVTGRTSKDYSKLVEDVNEKDVLKNSEKLTSIYFSPDTDSELKKDIGLKLQKALRNSGYDLPKSYIKGNKWNVDKIIGDETLNALKDWKSKNKSLAMGGSLPGSVGFTYARTKGIPSNGPYAKKTMASAQNGMEMKFYQEGLDWTPKNISRDGSEIPQAQLGLHMLTPDYSQVGENIMEMLSVPQKTLTKLFSGKYQTPSEAMNIKNPVGAFAVDAILDPANIVGGTAVSKIAKAATKASKVAKPAVSSAVKNVVNKTKNLEDLQSAQKFAKGYGYKLPENLERIAQSDELTNRTVRGLMNRHNTFVRGVSTNWDAIKESNPAVLRHLEELGIDYMNNPQQAAEYMATHIPGSTGYGRFGLKPGENAIYLSNSVPTAEGYTYGQGYVTKVKRPTDFSSANRQDWINSNDFNVSLDFKGSPYNQGIVKNDYIKRFPTNLRETLAMTGDPNKVTKLGEIIKEKEELYNKLSNEAWKRDSDNITKLRYKTDANYRRNILSDDLVIRDKPNFLDNLQLKYLEAKKDLTQTYYDNLPLKDVVKGIYGDPDVWKAFGKNLFGELDPFSHYAIKGTPGTKALEVISSKKINPEAWQNTSRSHINKYSNKLSRKEEGGEITKDDNGYWNPENWGEPVEIGSNEITMQGVYEPLLGISDTGDTQMMYPGEDYTFDGESVTEYPVAQNGKTLPTIYTDNPNDPRLRAYNDSLNLYKGYQFQKNNFKPGYEAWLNSVAENYPKGKEELRKVREKNIGKPGTIFKDKRGLTDGWKGRDSDYDPLASAEKPIVDYYKSLVGNNPNFRIGRHSSPDLWHKTIKPVASYYDGAISPVYKKPVQPIVYKKPQPKVETKKPEPTYVEKFGLTNDDIKSAFATKPISKKDGDPYYNISKGGKNFRIHAQSGGLDYIEEIKPPKPSVKSQPKQEPVNKEQPVKKEELKPIERKQNVYEGSPVYSPGAGSGLPSALIGFLGQQGDTTYIKPEDYERFAVPKYGKEFIESKTKKKNGGWLDRYN
jgi:hypothetical protein